MRDLLTILAGVVLVIFAAAAAVPPLVDWSAHRAMLEGAIERAAGIAIRTEGAIDLRLLPSPRIRVARMAIGQPDALSAEAHEVEAEMALTPLLSGEVRLLETRIGRLEILLATTGDRLIPSTLVNEGRRRRNWAVEDLTIAELVIGTLDGRSGRKAEFLAEDVRLDGQTLVGPWRAVGRTAGLAVTAATGELGPDLATPVKISIGGEGQPRLDLDSTLRLKELPGGFEPELSGSARLSPPAPLRGTSDGEGERPRAAPPIAVQTRFVGTRGVIALDEFALEAGEGASALRLTGRGTADIATRRVSLDLGSRRVDVDGFLASEAGRALGGSVLAQRFEAPVPLALKLRLDSLAFAGEEWTGLDLAAATAEPGLVIERAHISGPGGTRVSGSGQVAPGNVTGRVTVASESAERVAGLLERLGFGGLDGLADPRPVEGSADIAMVGPVTSLRNIRLQSGDVSLSGSLRYTAGEGPDPGAVPRTRDRLDAQLALEGLDLARLPPPDGLFAASRRIDLGLQVDGRRLGYGPDRAGRIAGRLATDGDAILVEKLEVQNLAGIQADLSGRLAPDGAGRLEGRLEARRAAPVVDFAGPAVFGGASRWIPPALREAPLKLAVTAERAAGLGDGRGIRTTLAGDVANARVAVTLLTGGGLVRSLSASISTDRVGAMLERGGSRPGPARPGALTLTGARVGQGPFELTVDGAVAGIAVATRRPLAFGPADDVPDSGELALTTADVSPMAELLGFPSAARVPVRGQLTATVLREVNAPKLALAGRLADTDVRGALLFGAGRDITGDLELSRLSLPWLLGATILPAAAGPAANAPWPPTRFGAPRAVPTTRLAVKAGVFELAPGLRGEGATFELATAPDGLSVRGLELALADGRVKASIAVNRQSGVATISGEGEARSLRLESLTGPGFARGRISGNLRFGASGESPAELAGNLAGGGALALDGVELPAADAAAVERIISRALRSDDPLSSPRLAALASEELGRGPLRLGPASAPATLVGGTLRAAPLMADAGASTWTGSLAVDLRTLTLEARGALAAKTPPRGWTGGSPYLLVGWRGPVSGAARTIDTGPLTNGLAAVVLQRELDRIEVFEADANERTRREAVVGMERARRAAAEEAAREARLRQQQIEAAERARLAAEAAARAQLPSPAPPPADSRLPGQLPPGG